MPEISLKRLPKSEVEISFRVTPEEAKPYLEEAAKALSAQRPLPGFRPGHAPLEAVQRVFGEMAVLEQALERIVRAFYVKTILAEQVKTVGSPNINVGKLVPGNDIEFTIIAPVEPEILSLPDVKTVSVEETAHAVSDEDVNKVVEDLRKSRRMEQLTDRASTEEDVITVDIEMKKDGVVVEGGTGTDYKVYLNEPHYLPGFTKELVGLKAGDKKTTTVKFPEDHYQKHLAGQEANVDVHVKAVHELALPAFDDAFATGLGLTTSAEVTEKIRENLALEAEQKSKEAAEIKLLETLVDQSKFEEIPEIMVNEEVRRMTAELQQGIEEQGMKWDDYLSAIKKTAAELRLEFVPQAIRRIKTAILLKKIAADQKIDVEETEIDAEIDRLLQTLRSDDKMMREHLTSADYRDYVMGMMRNRKTLEWLKATCIKPASGAAKEEKKETKKTASKKEKSAS